MRYNTKEIEAKMDKSVAGYEEMLGTIRANQANANVLSRVSFEEMAALGMSTFAVSRGMVNTMADIRVTDGRTLTITPYDKTTLKAMEKAILASDVGITPMNDGNVIRLTFPQMTEDRRREVCKQVQKLSEEAKVAIRNLRRDANDELKKQKKDGILTEDEQKDGEKSVQDLTDKHIKKIEAVTAAKEKEIMEI